MSDDIIQKISNMCSSWPTGAAAESIQVRRLMGADSCFSSNISVVFTQDEPKFFVNSFGVYDFKVRFRCYEFMPPGHITSLGKVRHFLLRRDANTLKQLSAEDVNSHVKYKVFDPNHGFIQSLRLFRLEPNFVWFEPVDYDFDRRRLMLITRKLTMESPSQ